MTSPDIQLVSNQLIFMKRAINELGGKKTIYSFLSQFMNHTMSFFQINFYIFYLPLTTVFENV